MKQTSHLKGLAFEWFAMCLFILLLKEDVSPQIGHINVGLLAPGFSSFVSRNDERRTGPTETRKQTSVTLPAIALDFGFYHAICLQSPVSLFWNELTFICQCNRVWFTFFLCFLQVHICASWSYLFENKIVDK